MPPSAGQPSGGRRPIRSTPKPVGLAGLAARIGAVSAGPDLAVKVSRVVFDHREVGEPDASGAGDLFFCIAGHNNDGHDFAAAAVAAGAVAVAVDHVVEQISTVPQLVVGRERMRQAMAEAACAVSGDPAARLLVVGVTGTNGKTTTTHLLRGIFEHNGWRCVLVGTLGGERTTPEAPVLQAALARAVADHRRAAVLEVTSHGLAEHRVDGFVHDVAVFTNLSRDHLDYHGTMEAYFGAKASLFTPEHARRGVVNADDAYGRKLLDQAHLIPLSPFGLADAKDRVDLGSESRFVLHGHRLRLRLAGELNVRNALAAAAAARAAGVDDATIAEALSQVEQVPGRFETVGNDLGVLVVVDYAHTPAGLASALEVVRRAAAKGRLVVVFGAGGDRDRDKRPLMGAAVAERADLSIITSDNPRHEDPDSIIAEVAKGFPATARPLIEPDRRKAIAVALAAAGPEDVVLVAGKGHETTQQIGDEHFAFEDRAVVVEEAARLAGGAPRLAGGAALPVAER